MQNRYTCDLGDFGKYGLLRHLCEPGLSLGVVWYLVTDEKKTNDGKHTSYLEHDHPKRKIFRRCDTDLYDSLAQIFRDGERSVTYIRERDVLPPGTIYFEDVLTYDGMKSIGPDARVERLQHRSSWLEKALEITAGCDVVFLDPDNGLEVKTAKHTKKGPKYAYIDEISSFLQRGQSVVVYHHLCRNGKADEQIENRFRQLRDKLDIRTSIFALCYHRGTGRVFFVIPSTRHEPFIQSRIDDFMLTPWKINSHFSLLTDLRKPVSAGK